VISLIVWIGTRWRPNGFGRSTITCRNVDSDMFRSMAASSANWIAVTLLCLQMKSSNAEVRSQEPLALLAA